METMYWIDVIGNISTSVSVLAVLSAAFMIICLIITSAATSAREEDDVAFGKKMVQAVWNRIRYFF